MSTPKPRLSIVSRLPLVVIHPQPVREEETVPLQFPQTVVTRGKRTKQFLEEAGFLNVEETTDGRVVAYISSQIHWEVDETRRRTRFLKDNELIFTLDWNREPYKMIIPPHIT